MKNNLNFILVLFVFLTLTACKNPLGGGESSSVPTDHLPGLPTTEASSSPCVDNALNSGSCVAAASRYVTALAGANLTNWSNGSGTTTVSGSLPTGFYSGNSCHFTEANLLATNIKNGVSVFGVTGTLTSASPACSTSGLQSAGCSAANGTYWTTSSSGNTTLSGTTSATIAQGYQSGSSTCSVSDANLIASNIKSGVSILGIAGAYSTVTLASGMGRSKTASQITQNSEVTTYAGTNTLPAGYRPVPDINADDDGNTGSSVTKVDRTGWGSVTCGTTGTIAARIADCAGNATLGANATWDGGAKGNAAQSVWKLVTRTGDLASNMGREVWQDQRTGLLWSSQVSRALYWCKAAGSNNITDNPFAQTDPSSYCDNSAYQTTGTTGQAVSACYEDGGNHFTTTDAGISNNGKGGLGLGSTPAVAWRLPSSYDYMQANVDGIRFVMPDMINVPTFEWSATLQTNSRTNAYAFIASSGIFQTTNTNANRTNAYAVRCVGR